MIEIKIEHPKLDMLYTAIALIIVATGLFYFFKIIAPKIIPPSLILAVPFSPQAPTDNWNRNEDCEETSITMANAFLNNEKEDRMPPAAAQDSINSLKQWEAANLGYNANTGADATTQMAEGAFGLKIKQIPNFTEDDLKRALNDGHPILLPINAKLLGSPQYLYNGPTYHMIVIRGFRDDKFIINDPGTDRGDGNEYSFTILQKAAADWNQTTKKIDTSKKIALVVSR